MKRERNIHIGLLLAFLAVFIWSGILPYNRQAWVLLSLPAIIIVSVLALTYRKFTFSTMVYVIVLFHVVVLLVGAHYTYTKNPLFDLLMEEFNLKRNYYDRVGHFAQGFAPAFITKELLIRGGYIKRGKMMYLIVISMCLGFSGAYELIEFATAKVLGMPVEYIMGIQGDYFDSVWDMFYALVGASISVFVFGPLHDRCMAKKTNKY
ncbi:MAG: rane protein [Firmicutes bacterium]|nr:rane protein [Bacillota bacterium]